MKNHWILFAVSLLVVACGKKEEQLPATPQTAREVAITEVVGLATVEPANRIATLSPEASGVIAHIEVSPSQQVKKGQLLFEMNHSIEEAQLQQARSKVKTQEDAIRVAEMNLASQTTKRANNQTTFTRTQNLFNGNAATQEALDNARFALEASDQDVLAAKATIAQQRSRLNELNADIHYAQSMVENRRVSAPDNGTILSVDVQEGEGVTPSSSLGNFAPEGPLVAITEVDELFASQIQIGQNAYVRLQGKNDTLAVGKVILAAPYLRKKSLFADGAGGLEDRRVREVRVELESGSEVLIGSRVECVISLKK